MLNPLHNLISLSQVCEMVRPSPKINEDISFWAKYFQIIILILMNMLFTY